jgi:hypothetical protein
MTDERTPGEQPPPDAATPAERSDDTTAQPTGTWQGSTTAPPPAQAAPQPSPTAPPPAQAAPQPAPAAVAWAPAPAATVPVRAGASPLSIAAGVLLVIGGVLGAIAGLAVAAVGPAVVDYLVDAGAVPEVSGMDLEEFLRGFIVFFGVLIVAYSLVYLSAGIGVLRSRDWGRVLGIIVGILSGLLWLGSVTTPAQPGVRDSIFGSLFAFAIHAYIVVALMFFWRRRAATG